MNLVCLYGNLAADPELKTVAQQYTLCNFSIAVNERTKKETKVHFFQCSAWGKTAENIAKYFTKGKPILVEGQLEQQQWEGKEGKRSKVVVKVRNFTFVGSPKSQSEGKADSQYSEGDDF